MSSFKMLVVTHKQSNIPLKKGYVPIVVGNSNACYSKMYRDNTGDNISNKNNNYCELTALYWAWKNLKNIDYIGLSHYRRYFMKSVIRYSESGFLSEKDVINLMKKYDVILPFPKGWFDTNVSEWFLCTDGKKEALEKLRETIMDLYPNYIYDYDEVMNGYMASYFNMFVMPQKYMNQYCEWLFEILFDLEKKIDLSNYTHLEARIYGFLSERLLNVWIKHNKLKVKYLFVNEIERNMNLKLILKDVLKYNAFSKKYLKWMTRFKWGYMKK